jgi:DNA-binding response OmpR family regulator
MGKATVLVVDDDEHIGEMMTLYLEREGYDTVVVRDGRAALQSARQLNPDMIILDLMLPEIDGMEVCRELRKESDIPIIMLTARVDDIDRILGLEMGADDYVTKPFNPREVVARVKAVLRRAVRHETEGGKDVLHFPGLSVDPVKHEVIVRGESIHLTRKELDLLYHLASHPGRVFDRDELLENVWGYDRYVGDARTVDTHIKRLRQKLEGEGESSWEIITIWGRGYKFETKD